MSEEMVGGTGSAAAGTATPRVSVRTSCVAGTLLLLETAANAGGRSGGDRGELLSAQLLIAENKENKALLCRC